MTILKGTVIKAGTLDETSDPSIGLIVVMPWQHLRNCPRNLAYAEVEIRFADEVEKEESAKEKTNES